ncbi:MAG: glycosyltransferase [Patescibacteria group bacterium]|nr:glycosyltransferase [Patescibacteria group bacterium]
MTKVFVFDPTASDPQSKVRGVGRYLQILKENFPSWHYLNKSEIKNLNLKSEVFINPFFNFLQPPFTLKRLAEKQIAVIHDLIPLKYPQIFPLGIKGKLNFFLNKLALKNYDLIITDSQASKKDIVKILKISDKKIKIIYPCLPKIFFEKKPINDWKFEIENFCLYVGDATWNKNLVNLAKAIKIINVSCVFVGKVFENWKLKIENFSHPWQKELRQFLEETKDDKRFIFLGFVDDLKLLKLYQQAKVNILISRDEGFGFSYLEAASQSCPSVLSEIPVLKEISGNQGAWFCDHNNLNDIANKIGEIYFNPQLKDKLGFEASKRANFFKQEVFKKQFQEIIELKK